MNVFDAFEDKVSHLFGDVNNAQMLPVSFKKIAQTAVRKMNDSVIDVDGTPVAPVLYTILVSSGDDAAMRSSYSALCDETSEFLKKKSREKGYYLSGKPLVRFMVDPSLKKGKFAVFAETVDTLRLETLRAEEVAFLNNSHTLGGAAQKQAVPEPSQFQGEEAGLGFLPDEIPSPEMPRVQLKPEVAPAPAGIVPIPEPQVVPVAPPTQKRPFVNNQVPSRSINPAPTGSTCMLIDRSSGRTYTATATTIIGRQRQGDNIVLNDTNVSRQHAQISHKGSNWYLEDLGSTNGCQVNGVDVEVAQLHTGDLLTLGITNLEVRID